VTVDDLGVDVPCVTPVHRVVSLVPSLTEAIAATRLDALVGATQWCTHPGDLEVTRVRGTKNPDLRAIRALQPDLVVANQEENRELDVRRLRDAGVPVWVTRIHSVPEAIGSMQRLFTAALGWPVPTWLSETERVWSGEPPPPLYPVAIAIWRDPWMVVGGDTFTSDLVRRLGHVNAYAGAVGEGRYPTVELAELDRPELTVLLPDEPYAFSADDGPEAFASARTRLVSGRLLTWYGPSLLEARALRF
jgi:ABC-type Fe3+-hydroxamate transport system substrate-binding protein